MIGFGTQATLLCCGVQHNFIANQAVLSQGRMSVFVVTTHNTSTGSKQANPVMLCCNPSWLSV
jgi:hypothetical protein